MELIFDEGKDGGWRMEGRWLGGDSRGLNIYARGVWDWIGEAKRVPWVLVCK